MEIRNMICISCPIGCEMEVHIREGELIELKHNQCPRGLTYATNEIENPKRHITTTIPINSPGYPMLSVKTSEEIPKSMIFEIMEEINKVEAKVPVKMGDVIIENILDTGVDILASFTVEK